MALNLILAALVLAPAPQQELACPARPAPLPAPYASWAAPRAVTAARDVAGSPAAPLEFGKAVAARLSVMPQVEFPYKSDRDFPPASFGGLFDMRVEQPGDYEIAINTGAWIDVVKAGQVVESTSHDRGPPCSGVRKAVVFHLTPGRYMVQIASNPRPDIVVLASRKP